MPRKVAKSIDWAWLTPNLRAAASFAASWASTDFRRAILSAPIRAHPGNVG